MTGRGLTKKGILFNVFITIHYTIYLLNVKFALIETFKNLRYGNDNN